MFSTNKKMPSCLFSKEACPVFTKATQGESKKDCQKATSSSDTKAKDRKKKQNESEPGWSDVATLME